MYLIALLGATFQLVFDAPPLQPGSVWVIPICARELGEGRMYPHIHFNYCQQYGGGFGFTITMEQGA